MRTYLTLNRCLLVLGGILAIIGGCSNSGAPDPIERQGEYQERSLRQNALTPRGNVPTEEMGNRRLNRIQSDQLARIVEQVPGVERAQLAMNATDVLVGIEVDNPGKRRIIEKQVFSALIWQYSEYNYHVTSDEKLLEKIKSVNARKADGKDAQMINRDIEALARSIDYNSSFRP